jgi:hypothetical protein
MTNEFALAYIATSVTAGFALGHRAAIRRYAIAAALWLAWIVLAPVDRLVNAHQRQKQIHRDRVERAGVSGKIRVHGSVE